MLPAVYDNTNLSLSNKLQQKSYIFSSPSTRNSSWLAIPSFATKVKVIFTITAGCKVLLLLKGYIVLGIFTVYLFCSGAVKIGAILQRVCAMNITHRNVAYVILSFNV